MKTCSFISKFQRSKVHFKVTCEVDNEPASEWKILKLSIGGNEVLSDLVNASRPRSYGLSIITVSG